MELLARLVALGQPKRVGEWAAEDFLRAANEGKLRYDQTEELFEIQYQMFHDAVEVIYPGFRIGADEASAIVHAVIPSWGNATWRIALYFLKWERCPDTAVMPNPYEPSVEIMEHGGYFQSEHGQYVDIHASAGQPCGFVLVRRA